MRVRTHLGVFLLFVVLVILYTWPFMRSRFQGTVGDADLYELQPLPEQGARLSRLVSYSFLRRHPVLQIAFRPSPGIPRWTSGSTWSSTGVLFSGSP